MSFLGYKFVKNKILFLAGADWCYLSHVCFLSIFVSPQFDLAANDRSALHCYFRAELSLVIDSGLGSISSLLATDLIQEVVYCLFLCFNYLLIVAPFIMTDMYSTVMLILRFNYGELHSVFMMVAVGLLFMCTL
jgi:hypothetical protein